MTAPPMPARHIYCARCGVKVRGDRVVIHQGETICRLTCMGISPADADQLAHRVTAPRYPATRFFNGLNRVIAGLVLLAGLLVALLGAPLGAAERVLVVLGATFIAVAIISAVEMFQILLAIEENTRAVRTLVAQVALHRDV